MEGLLHRRTVEQPTIHYTNEGTVEQPTMLTAISDPMPKAAATAAAAAHAAAHSTDHSTSHSAHSTSHSTAHSTAHSTSFSATTTGDAEERLAPRAVLSRLPTIVEATPAFTPLPSFTPVAVDPTPAEARADGGSADAGGADAGGAERSVLARCSRLPHSQHRPPRSQRSGGEDAESPPAMRV